MLGTVSMFGRIADAGITGSLHHRLPASLLEWAQHHQTLIATRKYKAHRVNRPNLAQPIDVNTLDTLLMRTTSPTSALLPVLKNLAYLNPRQTAYMLEKLPRMAALHVHRIGGSQGGSAWGPATGMREGEDQRRAQAALTSALRARMGRVVADCSPEQLRRALWGLAVAERSAGAVGREATRCEL